MTDKQFYITAGAVLVAAYFFGHKIAAAAGGAVDAITPTNHDNIFNRGFNAIGDILDDGDDNGSFSAGSAIYDLLHSDEV